MASSSENDENSSTDDNEDIIFYDANSSWTNNEIITSLPQDPRWALLSKNDSLRKPEHFCTISLTETQLNDIARRDKLQRLRAQEDYINQNNQNQITTVLPSPIEPNSIVSSITLSPIQSNQIEEQQSINDDKSIAPDLLIDHIDNEHTRRQKMV
ncbi:unnamed protein product [Rotaria sordida]|uniref:Uncharacterized protein n=1 Tax=Rotaria sordida TaxID=392033 RepID=A0A816FQU0_9BILA|nr:unnamed protein product [Rotaria sordida]CAF1664794.1 unnamed protein product [Rotaria sordida]